MSLCVCAEHQSRATGKLERGAFKVMIRPLEALESMAPGFFFVLDVFQEERGT